MWFECQYVFIYQKKNLENFNKEVSIFSGLGKIKIKLQCGALSIISHGDGGGEVTTISTTLGQGFLNFICLWPISFKEFYVTPNM